MTRSTPRSARCSAMLLPRPRFAPVMSAIGVRVGVLMMVSFRVRAARRVEHTSLVAIAEGRLFRHTVSNNETMPLDLETVRAFVKVAELESFTLAGEQLGVSKSRASLRVRALETELGSQLLSRSTRTVSLTPDGEQFLLRARRLLADADELTAMFQ